MRNLLFVLSILCATTSFAAASETTITKTTTTTTSSINESHATIEETKESNYGHTKNLRFYPGEIFLGGMRADFLFKIDKSPWAVGPMIGFRNYNWAIFKENSASAGVTSLYAFAGDPMMSTFYWAPEIMYRQGRAGMDMVTIGGEAQFRAIMANVTVGYQFMWKNFGLNLGVGGDFTYLELRDTKGRYNLLGLNGTTDSSTNVSAASGFGLIFDLGLSIPL